MSNADSALYIASDEELAAKLASEWAAEVGMDPASSQDYEELKRRQSADEELARKLYYDEVVAPATLPGSDAPSDRESRQGSPGSASVVDSVANSVADTPIRSLSRAVSPGSVHKAEIETTPKAKPLRNAFEVLRQASSTKPKIQAYDYRPSSHTSSAINKRKFEDHSEPLLVISDDEDVAVISELPAAVFARNGSSARTKRRLEHTARPFEGNSAQSINQNLHASPSLSHHGPRPVSSGSANEPIMVEDDDQPGPSGTQQTNGFMQYPWLNARSLPWAIPGLPPARPTMAQLQGVPSYFNGLAASFASQAAAQRTVPLPGTVDMSKIKNGENPYALNNLAQSRFYQDVYAQNALSEEDLRNLLDNIKDTDIPSAERAGNPLGLTKTLMEHQRVGLTWLRGIEDGSNKGGILADAMG